MGFLFEVGLSREAQLSNNNTSTLKGNAPGEGRCEGMLGLQNDGSREGKRVYDAERPRALLFPQVIRIVHVEREGGGAQSMRYSAQRCERSASQRPFTLALRAFDTGRERSSTQGKDTHSS